MFALRLFLQSVRVGTHLALQLDDNLVRVHVCRLPHLPRT